MIADYFPSGKQGRSKEASRESITMMETSIGNGNNPALDNFMTLQGKEP